MDRKSIKTRRAPQGYTCLPIQQKQDHAILYPEMVYNLFNEQKLTMTEIAEIFGVHPDSTLYKCYKNFKQHPETNSISQKNGCLSFFYKPQLSPDFRQFLERTNLTETKYFFQGTRYQCGWWWRKWNQLQEGKEDE